MRFEPAEFIKLCSRNGVSLHREGPFICWSNSRKWRDHEEVLAEALRRHKDELMPLLPNTDPQADLFDPYD